MSRCGRYVRTSVEGDGATVDNASADDIADTIAQTSHLGPVTASSTTPAVSA
jgi:hypothetical protein